MTKREQLEQKVASASETELVVLLLEDMMNRFDDGMTAIEKRDPMGLKAVVEKVRAILGELLATLWGDSEVAVHSRQIYLYLNKLVTDAGNRAVLEPLEEAKQVLRPLLEGWRQIARYPQAAQSAPGKSPSVIAGMTYGKGTLNENVLNSGERLGKG